MKKAVKKNKNSHLIYSIGLSKAKDSYNAGKEAASKSLKGLKNKKPKISLVFFAGNYDPYKLSKGLKSVLNNSEFVGGSADSVFYNNFLSKEGVLVVSLYSDYLNVGVASYENASKDPRNIAKKTILEAMSKVPINKYVDPYLLFTRMKNTDVSWMVKIPSFFVILFTRGIKLPVMGDETKIIKGISEVIGLQVPIFGGSFGTDAMKVLNNQPYEIYMLHSGKVMKDGLIILFNSTSLLYSNSMANGCKPTEKEGFISEVQNNGFVVTKISNKDAVDWYAEQLGLSRDEFLKNVRFLTQLNPLGIPDHLGNYLIRGGGIYTGKGLAYVAPLVKGWPVYIMDGSAKNLMDAADELQEDIDNYLNKKEKPALIFSTLCVTRELVYQKDTIKEVKKLRKKFRNANVVGFTCFGETGSKVGQQAKFEHVTLNILNIYNKLMTQL